MAALRGSNEGAEESTEEAVREHERVPLGSAEAQQVEA